ncbi:hypothetical protein VT69_02945 [Yersinia pestis]|nr:hypothetical protein VT69_02945 [Yersinia pestis]
MVGLLAQHETGSRACRAHVVYEIRFVDGGPNAACALARLVRGKRGVAVKVGVRIRERALLKAEEALLVPARDIARASIDIHGEVEQITHRQSAPGNGRL